jgi:cytochrome c biogenesis protein CcdA
MPETKNDHKERAIDFLLVEYNLHYQEKKRNNEIGTTHLNFFITLTSSVLGGLAVIGGFGTFTTEQMQIIAVLALLFLSLVGWGTLRSIVQRSISLDKASRAMARIRAYFSQLDPAIKKHLTWSDVDEPTSHIGVYRSTVRTTAHTILSILAAMAIGLSVNLLVRQPGPALLAGAITLVMIFFLTDLYIVRQFKQAQLKAEKEIRFPEKSAQGPEHKTKR